MRASDRLRASVVITVGLLAVALMPRMTLAQAVDATALADTLRQRIERVTAVGDLNGITQVRAHADRAVARFPDDAWLHHYRGYALYREVTITMGRAPQTDLDELLETAQKALETALTKRDIPETRALLASVIGQRIGSNPIRGMTLGPRSDRQMEAAMNSGAENPRVWLLNGIGSFHKPRMFGGGMKSAETALRRSIALYARDVVQPPAPAWGHDEAWLWLGRALEEQQKFADARAAYRRALELQPDNAWVRDLLLPRLEERLRADR